MPTTHIDIARLEEYMKTVVSAANAMIDKQTVTETAFNALAESWNDSRFLLVGTQLSDVGKGMQKAFSKMQEPLDRIYVKCRDLCINYLEIEPPAKYAIQSYSSNIRTEGTMSRSKASANSDDVYRFWQALGNYIEEEHACMERIIRAHNDIHETWSDNQYDKFTYSLGDFITAFNYQMENIKILHQMIFLRYKALKEYEG